MKRLPLLFLLALSGCLSSPSAYSVLYKPGTTHQQRLSSYNYCFAKGEETTTTRDQLFTVTKCMKAKGVTFVLLPVCTAELEATGTPDFQTSLKNLGCLRKDQIEERKFPGSSGFK